MLDDPRRIPAGATGCRARLALRDEPKRSLDRCRRRARARASTYYYRAMAFDADERRDREERGEVGNREGAIKGARRARGSARRAPAPATSGLERRTTVRRHASTYYKLVYSARGRRRRSYLGERGGATAWAGEGAVSGTAAVGELPSGTYWFRIQVIRIDRDREVRRRPDRPGRVTRFPSGLDRRPEPRYRAHRVCRRSARRRLRDRVRSTGPRPQARTRAGASDPPRARA